MRVRGVERKFSVVSVVTGGGGGAAGIVKVQGLLLCDVVVADVVITIILHLHLHLISSTVWTFSFILALSRPERFDVPFHVKFYSQTAQVEDHLDLA